MKKKLLIAFGVFAGIIALFLGYVALQPSEYSVVRAATIDAPPATVFPHVNNFHKWDAWSPWAKLDPNAKNSFEGPSQGEGAAFGWSGNDKVGEGKMTILESKPSDRILIKLDFIKPFEDTCNVEFTFKPEGEKTHVTWNMAGKSNFVGKIMCVFMNMDTMVGGDFEKGLANLKEAVAAAEKEKPPEEQMEPETTTE